MIPSKPILYGIAALVLAALISLAWVWLTAVAGIAFYIWRSTRKAEAAIIEAVQTGARR